MGIFSDVYHKRNRVALKELAKRSQGTASGNTQGVREELRQVFSRLEMQPGYPKPSEAEQAFGFAAWVMWFLRFMAVSQQERNEICEKVDRTAAGAALFMRVLMSNPEHSEALRRGIPGFDPKDANTPLNSVGARFALVVQHLCRLYVIRGELPAIQSMAMGELVLAANELMRGFAGTSAAEFILPAGIASSEQEMFKFGLMVHSECGRYGR